MSKRKAFWGTSIRHRIPGSVNGKLMDAEVSASGARLIETVTNSEMRWVPWAELHKLVSAEKSSTAKHELHLGPRLTLDKIIADTLHGPLNESAPLRILPVEESE